MSRRRTVVLAAAVCGAVLAVGAPAATAQSSCAGATSTIAASNISASERTIVCLVNEFRAQNGLKPLAIDTRLQTAARKHSEDMVARKFFDHESPDGTSPQDRAAAAGYGAGVGENIVEALPATPTRLVELWKGSPGHRRNMLTTDYVATGVGVAFGTSQSSGGANSTQLFGVGGANTTDTGAGGGTGGQTNSCTKEKAAVTTATKRYKDARAKYKAASGDAKRKAKKTFEKRKRQLTKAKTTLASCQTA